MVNRRTFAKALAGTAQALILARQGAAAQSSAASRTENAGVERISRDLHQQIEPLPVDDTHCHALTDKDAQTTPDQFLERMALAAMPEARYFPPGVLERWRKADATTRKQLDTQFGIEKTIGEIIFHFRESVFVRFLTKEMARYLRCKPDLQSVIAARNERGRNYAQYIGDLFRDARLAHVMVDTGFNEGMDESGFRAFERAIAPTKMRTIARVETIQAPLLREDLPFAELTTRFTESVRKSLDETGNFGWRAWGMKSYLLPRLGLVQPHYDSEAAKKSWEEYRSTRTATGDRETLSDRGRKLQEYLFTIALEECLKRDMPMQMHAGDGEAPGVILRRQHPYFLEEVVRFDRDGIMRMPKIIPIHAGYPLVGEAAWLSHLYTNCYFEISLMNPLIHQGLVRRFLEIFEAVPLSKILFGSDAYHLPEFY
ncbi:MAG: amidohydrolase family protein, partial [Bryobacteraceae bacterium]|nr:amidohydrolase family protein [Bryobacteraceae bacterium]